MESRVTRGAAALAFVWMAIATPACVEGSLGELDPPSGDSPDTPSTPGAAGDGNAPDGTKKGDADRSENAPSSQAPRQPNGGPPSQASCDRTKPFGAPLPVNGLPSSQHLATPRLSSDELTIYFTAHVGGVAKLHQAVRPSTAAPFGPPQPLDAQTSSNGAKDNDPSISSDGLTLWFSSERNAGGSGDDDLFFATRAAPTGPFGTPIQVPIVNTSSDEQHPYFRSTGNELWFSSSRSGTWSIYTARRTPMGWEPAAIVKELQSTTSTRQPMIAEDGLTIIFASEREGGIGKRDIWQAQRPTVASPFSAPRAITEINSSANEFAGWLSVDGCRIYFSSDREAADRHRIFVASR